MNISNNERWIIPFKKFSRLKVNIQDADVYIYILSDMSAPSRSLEQEVEEYAKNFNPFVENTSESCGNTLTGHKSSTQTIHGSGEPSSIGQNLEGSQSYTNISDTVMSSSDKNIKEIPNVGKASHSDATNCYDIVTKNGLKMFQCGYEGCGKLFARKFNLDRHFVTHDGEKLFECSFCGLKCSRSYNLRVHILRKHHNFE